MATKTRNLSPAEYFLEIQKEYALAEFRSKIYTNPHDRAYYKRVMRYKAEKINDIANRNGLLSILTDKVVKTDICSYLFDFNGRPKWKMGEADQKNYFAVGNEFSYRGKVWLLDQINHDDTLTLYSSEGECYEKVNRDDVCRIL